MNKWTSKNLRDITLLLKDGTHGTHENVKEGIMLLSAKDLVGGKVVPQGDVRIIGKEDYDRIHQNYRLENGDVLISLVGTIGNVSRVRDYKGNYTFQRSVGIIRANEDFISNDFIYYFFLSNYGINKLRKYENKGAQGGVYLGNLGSILVPFPVLEEQKEIITTIEKWDKYIELLDKKIEVKKNVEKYLCQQLLSRNIRLTGCHGDWEEFRIKELGDVVIGNTPSTKYSEYYDSEVGYPWVTPTDINNTSYIHKTEKFLTEKGLEKARVLPPNTLLVTCIASIGKNVILGETGSCNQQINAILPSPRYDTLFLYYYLSYYAHRLKAYSGGGTMQIVNKKDFSNFKVTIPSLPEQKAISSILTQSNKEIELLENKKTLIEQQRKYLINNLVTGNIRLPKFKNNK